MRCSARRLPTPWAFRAIRPARLPPSVFANDCRLTIPMAKRPAARQKTLRERFHHAARQWSSGLGPGIVTGAADDDPSGIATYSQAGAQFGYGLLWTMLLTYPLMSAVQLVSAHIGRVTGTGLANSLTQAFPKRIVGVLI